MARFLRKVPPEVARQALINKTINAEQLTAAAAEGDPLVDERDLRVLAERVAAPELMPYEYAYVDLLSDGRGNFFVQLDDTFYRRSFAKRLQPEA